MYCVKCGKMAENGAKFCVYCGAVIIPAAELTGENDSRDARPVQQKHARFRNPVLLAIVIAAGIVICAIVIKLVSQRIKDAGHTKTANMEVSAETEDQDQKKQEYASQEPVAAEEKPQQSGETEQPEERSDFFIDENTVADYGACLDTNQYAFYDSGIGLFSFSYPQKLFNRVEFSQEKNDLAIGNQTFQNIQSIQFYASDGSEALFQVTNRLDLGGIDPKLKEIYDAENHIRFQDSGYGEHHYEDGYGYFYLTGITDNRSIYEFVRMEDKLLYRFFMIQEPESDVAEQIKKEYVLTCMQRMTGFAKTRTIPEYEEFALQKGKEIFPALTTEQLAELEHIAEYFHSYDQLNDLEAGRYVTCEEYKKMIDSDVSLFLWMSAYTEGAEFMIGDTTYQMINTDSTEKMVMDLLGMTIETYDPPLSYWGAVGARTVNGVPCVYTGPVGWESWCEYRKSDLIYPDGYHRMITLAAINGYEQEGSFVFDLVKAQNSYGYTIAGFTYYE